MKPRWPRRGWWALLAALLAAQPALAAPRLLGLFVGIDSYAYAVTDQTPGALRNLRGAVADAGAMKKALSMAYGLALDVPVAGKCRSSNAVSITLTDACATREAILRAFAGQIGAAAAGDTVLFYFAGHGSRMADDQVQDQASGYNSTLLPTDARKPGAEESAEILDREIRGLIDIASARGVNVVTVFDSCNSGSGARGEMGEGTSRGVSPVAARPVVPVAITLPRGGRGGGYRVHFGAARDDEEAREVRSGDGSNGVFTTALTQAIIARPDATFGDLAVAIRLKVQQAGQKNQHPQAEGALQERFAGSGRHAALFDAAPDGEFDGGGAMLGAGRLLGMTAGSRFALFASQSDALDPAAQPLARGSLALVEDGRSRITLDAAPATPLPQRLVAREIQHAWDGAARLRISVGAGDEPASIRMASALRSLPFVDAVGVGEPALLSLGYMVGAGARMLTRDGFTLAALGDPMDAAFADRVRQALLTVYNAERLAALPAVPLGDARIDLCLSHQLDHPAQACPEPTDRQRSLTVDRELVMTVTNASDQARYVTVLVIDDRYAIVQLIPAGSGRDEAMASYAVQRRHLALDSPGLYRFVVITSDVPIATTLLQQAGVRSDYAAACAPAEQDCDTGGRDGGIVPLGAWTTSIADALVLPRGKTR